MYNEAKDKDLIDFDNNVLLNQIQEDVWNTLGVLIDTEFIYNNLKGFNFVFNFGDIWEVDGSLMILKGLLHRVNQAGALGEGRGFIQGCNIKGNKFYLYNEKGLMTGRRALFLTNMIEQELSNIEHDINENVRQLTKYFF